MTTMTHTHNTPMLPSSPVDRLLGMQSPISADPTVSNALMDRLASLRMENNAAVLADVIIGESVTVGADGVARVSYAGHGDATDRATITAAIHRTTNGPAR